MPVLTCFSHAHVRSFTQDVYSFLVGGTSYPQEVIDLPKEFLSTPFGRSLQPMINDMFQRGHTSASTGTPVQPPPQLAQQFASNPALSGALQQVAQAATRSQTQPQAPLPTPADAVSSQLTVATNMASFHSLLSTNRCEPSHCRGGTDKGKRRNADITSNHRWARRCGHVYR